LSCNFLSTTFARTDAKARLSVPAGYRRKLEEAGDQRIVLLPNLTEPAVQAYPMALWLERVKKISALPPSHPVVRRVKKVQFAMACEVIPDGHGRVLLTPELRAHAGIAAPDDVAIVGEGEFFELWNAERWRQESAQALAELASDIDAFVELGL
jgi:MraZ protein